MQFDFRNKVVAFRKRQTQSPATRRERVFDAAFGILVPAFYLFVGLAVLDEGPAPIALFAYLEITIESIALGYYLLFCRSSPFLAGVLLAGALFSCLIAIVFLLFIPFAAGGFVSSLSQPDLALFFVFALIFSLVPMATAFVFCRNTERCLKGGRTLPSRTRPQAVAALACIIAIGAPVAIQLVVFRLTHYSIQVVLSGSEEEVSTAVRTLKWLYVLPSVNVEQLASSYKSSTDPNLRERLSSAYRSITGRSIEHLSRDFHPM
jgi:hypothetical protein